MVPNIVYFQLKPWGLWSNLTTIFFRWVVQKTHDQFIAKFFPVSWPKSPATSNRPYCLWLQRPPVPPFSTRKNLQANQAQKPPWEGWGVWRCGWEVPIFYRIFRNKFGAIQLLRWRELQVLIYWRLPYDLRLVNGGDEIWEDQSWVQIDVFSIDLHEHLCIIWLCSAREYPFSTKEISYFQLDMAIVTRRCEIMIFKLTSMVGWRITPFFGSGSGNFLEIKSSNLKNLHTFSRSGRLFTLIAISWMIRQTCFSSKRGCCWIGLNPFCQTIVGTKLSSCLGYPEMIQRFILWIHQFFSLIHTDF